MLLEICSTIAKAVKHLCFPFHIFGCGFADPTLSFTDIH